MASVAQIKNRIHSGHRDMLRRIQAGQWAIPEGCSAGAYRGYRTIWSTLVSWELVDTTATPATLTVKGAEVING